MRLTAHHQWNGNEPIGLFLLIGSLAHTCIPHNHLRWLARGTQRGRTAPRGAFGSVWCSVGVGSFSREEHDLELGTWMQNGRE